MLCKFTYYSSDQMLLNKMIKEGNMNSNNNKKKELYKY